MDARFYNSEDIDIERLATDIVNVYLAQGYQAQQIGNRDQILVQLKKGGDFEAIIGMQAAVTLTLQRTTGGILAMLGRQRWIDKAAVGTVGLAFFAFLWPLAITAGAGAIRQASLGNQVLNVVDGLVRQQQPNVLGGPIPAQLLPQAQQQWGQPNSLPSAPTPYYIPQNAQSNVVNSFPPSRGSIPAPLRCTQCNTPYEPGDTFCSGCGRALATPRQYCPNCNSELKPGIAFCSKCGASTFQGMPLGQVQPAPASLPQQSTYTPPPTPAYTPPAPAPTPVYTPPAPAPTPIYTPPPVYQAPPQKPPTPVYQPPARPEPPAYTPPTTQTPEHQPPTQVYYVPSNDQPTVADPKPAPKKPEEPYYVPKVMQNPAPPQPKVTIVQSTSAHEPPPPQKSHQQKQYYIPSNQVQANSDETLPSTTTMQAASDETLPATVAAPSQSTPWGSLAFQDGTQMQLTGERAVIGRYDHDLGGIHPEVDLSQTAGSDTVSRIHAALEPSGTGYILTDLNSTNATRINGKRLEPDTPTPVNDGDTLQFGKITCTFKQGV